MSKFELEILSSFRDPIRISTIFQFSLGLHKIVNDSLHFKDFMIFEQEDRKKIPVELSFYDDDKCRFRKLVHYNRLIIDGTSLKDWAGEDWAGEDWAAVAAKND